MKDTSKADNRRHYDAAFRAEAFRLAAQSPSTQVAARALIIDPKRLYQWYKAAQTPVVTTLGAALNLATAAKLCELQTANQRQTQELAILKKANASACLTLRLSQTPDQ